MKLASLFSGAGGLDLGFEKSGFSVLWANEYDKTIWDTFEHNFPGVVLDKRSITDVPASEVPDIDGIIGGPPCQSWSEAGALRGIDDHRGQLFFEYVRMLEAKKPLFFLAENVSGMLHLRHSEAIKNILAAFSSAGYNVNWKLLNAKDYSVPQDRKRVIFVGIRKDMKVRFQFPPEKQKKITLRDAIFDLKETAVPALEYNKTHGDALQISNHEYMHGSFSTIYMSRNRVRSWDEQSFTIQAGGRHAPIHPQAPKMLKRGLNDMIFVEGEEHLYRRLSVRECARIQTFPDNFIFKYSGLSDGYKMVGNAVPVNFANALGQEIMSQMTFAIEKQRNKQGISRGVAAIKKYREPQKRERECKKNKKGLVISKCSGPQ